MQGIMNLDALYGKAILDIEDCSIFLLDMNGNIQSWNKGAERIKGYTSEEVVGKNFSMFYTEEDKEKNTPDNILKAARAEARVQHEGWQVGKFDDIFWANVVITAVHDEDNNFVGFIKVTRDLSERMAAEKIISEYERDLSHQAKQSEKIRETYFSFINEVEDYAIIMLDDNGYIIDWNNGAEKIKGYTNEEAIGKHFSILFGENDKKLLMPDALLMRARTEGKSTHEGWRIKKDGTKFWASVTIKTIYDENRDVKGFVKITKDLSEQRLKDKHLDEYAKKVKEKEQIINVKGEKLDKSTRARERFHRAAQSGMQQPMKDIMVAVEKVKQALNGNDKETALAELQKIATCAFHSKKQMQDLVWLGVILEDKIDSTPTKFSLKKLLEGVNEKMLSDTSSTNSITLAYDGDEHTYLPLPLVNYVVENFLSNAIKYTPLESVIQLKCNNAGDSITIQVTDNGVGIPKDEQDSIFDSFFRGSNAEFQQGAGLSLYVVKSLVEHINGSVTCESELKKGATFTATIPVSKTTN